MKVGGCGYGPARLKEGGPIASPAQIPDLVFKIATRDVAEAARESGIFTGMAIDHADGFLHFSTAEQLRETLRLHFAGQRDLALLAVPTAKFRGELKWEPSRGGQLFPHLYGTFSMANVAHEATIDVSGDGAVRLPDWVA